jgi:hypothetical protein
MKQRIIGFDLARAYAILGMYIVNFNTVFGSLNSKSVLGKFLSLFSGNSSSTFVILAGMGIALMTNKVNYTKEEKQKLQKIISRRSWFLLPLACYYMYGGQRIYCIIMVVICTWLYQLYFYQSAIFYGLRLVQLLYFIFYLSTYLMIPAGILMHWRIKIFGQSRALLEILFILVGMLFFLG